MTTLKVFIRRFLQLIISALASIFVMTRFFSELGTKDFLCVYIISSFTLWTILLSLENK